MTNNTPTVSVVMPVFNHSASMLKSAVESILNQTFKDFELIITDGNSNNTNIETISSIKDPRIRYFKTNGYINCLNLGIQQARGKYIARMDSDDISLPDRLAELVYFMDNNPDVSLCSSITEYYGDAKKIKYSPNTQEVNLINIIKKQEVVHPAMMFRKDLNIKFEHIKPTEDCLLFRKLLLENKKIKIVNKVLYKSFISINSIMKRHPKLIKLQLSKINIYSLVKYYKYPLSYAEEIITKKKYSQSEVLEFLNFIEQYKTQIKKESLSVYKICSPYLHYILSKSNQSNLCTHPIYIRVFLLPKIWDALKIVLQHIFSIKNQYKNSEKKKVVTILGIHFCAHVK